MKECSFEVVSPDLARQWLDLNHRNRTLSSGTVTRLAGVMRRGEWMDDSTDALGIDADGGVINGQHRLGAVIEADTSVEMLVVRGVRPDVIKVIDQGRGRTFTQWLQMDGRYTQPTTVAAAVVWLYRMIDGYEVRMPESVRPSVPQLLDLLEEHKNIEASVEIGVGVYKKLGLERAAATAYHYAMASVDADRADEFFDQLVSGEGLNGTDPVKVLRDRYVANMAAPDSKKANVVNRVVWLVKAWNAAAAGEQITSPKLTWRHSGKNAEAFPKVAGLAWLAGPEELVS